MSIVTLGSREAKGRRLQLRDALTETDYLGGGGGWKHLNRLKKNCWIHKPFLTQFTSADQVRSDGRDYPKAPYFMASVTRKLLKDWFM